MRQKNDTYFTEESATKELLKVITFSGNVLEPCCGKGSMVNVLKKHPNIGKIYTNDIEKKFKTDTHFDATGPILYDFSKYHWIITNPPFSKALQILTQAMMTRANLAFFLRISFLEPTYDRSPLLFDTPPTKLHVLPRMSFTGDGKMDNVTCAWFIWEAEHHRPTKFKKGTISVLPKYERKKK